MSKKIKKEFIQVVLLIIDLMISPLVFLSSIVMLFVRRIGLRYLKVSRKILLAVGVIPIRRHYYEPLFHQKDLSNPLSIDRRLPGIDWNIPEQLNLLDKFDYADELKEIPDEYVDEYTFHFNNDAFKSGDAEYLYSMIRLKKPHTIIEIGSGFSTRIAHMAIKANEKEDNSYHCEHICIEPYEMPWLENLGVTVVREKVENVKRGLFKKLGENDLLFIDSSHIIRPQGDVVHEYLEILPILSKGVIVHIHDIFSPRDYPKEWVFGKIKFFNEQYMLEAFLTSNSEWKIIGSLNLLHHKYYRKLKAKCPKLTKGREPGSFYIVKRI